MSTEREKLKEKLRTGKIVSVEPLTHEETTKLDDAERVSKLPDNYVVTLEAEKRISELYTPTWKKII
jgi:hypothetical protein